MHLVPRLVVCSELCCELHWLSDVLIVTHNPNLKDVLSAVYLQTVRGARAESAAVPLIRALLDICRGE
ncbi:hypothetical protein NDU88_010672 [Pleurodeles waltl]|uniref:Uncharacterized protein n=1 Tax=Pleurodeles waltl TaxID=8319 RepID=A0AAV7R0Z8_PLEWA|nr:hypothetical protein NDU88_010672 [Pleurodeles waltl]